MAQERTIRAAGGVVWRKGANPTHNGTSIEILAIHRPKYDDWTLPKGKLEPGETLRETAIREIFEETGLEVRLGVPLQQVEYRVASGPKLVDYWVARPIGGTSDRFTPNHEVDQMRWIRLGNGRPPGGTAVRDLLTYPHDRDVIDEFRTLRAAKHHKTRTLIVQRHAEAIDRDDFGGVDLKRPLDAVGLATAKTLTPALASYGVDTVVSSPALRCVETVEPYAHSVDTLIEIDERMGEDTTPALLRRSLAALLERKKPTVICTHRPNLPEICTELGIDPVALKPGEAFVVHHRKGTVCATEHIPIRSC